MKRTTAVAYLRVSGKGQLDGYGLDIQEQQVSACAKTNRFKLVEIIRDEGVSGTLEAADRPGLAEALAMIENSEAEVLLVPRLDRLARSLTVQEAALAQAWRHGGRVFACDSGEVLRDDPDDPMRTAMRQMVGVFAQLDKAMTVARLKRGRAAKKAAGGRAVGAPPFGYRAVDGKLVSSPTEQEAIALMRELRQGGSSYRQIVTALEAGGHPTKLGRRWKPNTVRRILDASTATP